MVLLKIVLNFSRFKPALNRNRFWWDLRRGLNSLNFGHWLYRLISLIKSVKKKKMHNKYKTANTKKTFNDLKGEMGS